MNATKTYDLVITWVWEFDHEFVLKLQHKAAQLGIEFCHVTVYDIMSFCESVLSGNIHMHSLIDRASDVDDSFAPLKQWAITRNIPTVNPYNISEKAINKALMQPILNELGITTPKTIVVPPFDKAYDLPQFFADNISNLTKPFVVKPALGGGGDGVVKSVWSYDEFLNHRQYHEWDHYLVQEKIYPKFYNNRRCWFRAYYIYGDFEAVWWDDETLIYHEMTIDEKQALNLFQVESEMKKIAHNIKMDFFSSEYVLTEKNEWVIIDYVNDQVDMRPKSRHHDGVPDRIVDLVVEKTCRFAQKCLIENTPIS